ncbi:hypothetical protein [Wolbachia pipientis]|nr:hypothetical protein [Wolbachia pipientis]MCM1001714.1 hypothetical protein [Wolbachia pipientis]
MSIKNDLIIKATANNSVDERYDNPTFTTFGYTAPGEKKQLLRRLYK